MKFTNKAAAVLLSGAMVIAFAPAAPAAFAADTATDTPTTTATAETGHDADATQQVTLENGTYTVPVSTGYGMFGLEETATVVVNGDDATVTITSNSTPDGNGAPKYDAIYLGTHETAPEDASTAHCTEGTPIYVTDGVTSDNTWKDSTNKVVDKYSFTFTVTQAQLNAGVNYIPRYTSHYVNSKGSDAYAGKWSGTKDYTIDFSLAKAQKQQTVTLENGTYTIPVSTGFGMFGLEENASVVVSGDEATVTITSNSAPDGNGAPKYDAIWLGKRADAPEDASTAKCIEGTPVYVADGATSDNTWKDSTNKVVDKYAFTFTVKTSELASGVNYVARYTSHYVNSKGSDAYAGKWSGTHDNTINFDLAKAQKAASITLADGTYNVPAECSFGMFGFESPAQVTVKGDKVTVTVTSDTAPDGNGAPKYDAIALGHHDEVVNGTNVTVINGVPVYAGANYKGDNTWKDSTNKVVDKYQFTFETTQEQLNNGIYFVARYTGHYVNKSGSAAYAGKWSGTKDNTITFDLANAQKVETPVTPAKKAAKTFTVNVATVNAAAVKKAAKKAGATAKSATSITIGTKAKKISKGAFKGYKKVKTLTVKTKKLTKKSVKGSLKGSAVKTVKVPKAKKAAYKKIFTKANAGKKVTVK